MAIQQILKYPHSNLVTKTLPIEVFDESIKTLEADLIETAIAHNAEGLAANQTYSTVRALVVKAGEEEGKPVYTFMANPRVVVLSGNIKNKEGCLSFPNIYEVINRAEEVSVHYQDSTGESHMKTFSKNAAIQHELDHLDGITFLDRMGKMQRRLVEKKLLKLQREQKHRMDNLKKQLGITLED